VNSLQEVEIKTGGFAPEYAALGGILNVVTKSGSQVDLVAGLDLRERAKVENARVGACHGPRQGPQLRPRASGIRG
jgi:hypothetical protein